MVVVVPELFEPHPACRKTRTKKAPINNPNNARRLRDIVPPIPNPRNASPETGNQTANTGPRLCSPVVVVVRAVVFTTRARLCGPLFKFVIDPFGTEQEAPVGSPVQDNETELGKAGALGVTVAL